VAGDHVAIVDSATATASTLAELLSINGLEAPGTAGARGSGTPPAARPSHIQYTTGDVDAFTALAAQLFGFAVADVRPVELRVAAS
jgi:glutamate racemase